MPLYEFECRKCKAHFDEMLPMSHKENPPCPECESPETEKVITGCAIGGGASGCGHGGFT